MALGVVKWFNTTKGYGFIVPEKEEETHLSSAKSDERPDIFVHITALQASKIPHLMEGQRVSYELDQRFDNRKMAVNITVVD